MSEMNTFTNEDRANRARTALRYYSETFLAHSTLVIGDLLADLMHLCAEEKFDFNKALQDAQWNFNEEVKDESAK
jgi:hypothetical protein